LVLLCFLLGGAIGILFALSETWINALATEEARGRIIGLYSSVLSLGFASGPFLLTWTGTSGWTPFVVGLTFVGLSAFPLLWARDAAPRFAKEERASLIIFVRGAPTLLAGVAVFALFDTATMALLPVYALKSGMRRPRRRARSAPLWPLLFVWGATGAGIYTMALAGFGARFTGPMMVAGAAAFTAMWGAGPLLGGVAMGQLGPHGLPLLLGATFLGLAANVGGRR
jgi:MFS family permease